MEKTPFLAPLSEAELQEIGITFCGCIPTTEIVFSEEVRKICAGNVCRNYGKTWACPPGVGSFTQCRDACLKYGSAFVFASRYVLEDSFDYEGMVRGHRQFKEVCDKLHRHLRQPCLLLSNEGCVRCKVCTYPDSPCRYPDKLFPALEGYGILVNALAERTGIPYNGGANTVTYFGMVCF